MDKQSIYYKSSDVLYTAKSMAAYLTDRVETMQNVLDKVVEAIDTGQSPTGVNWLDNQIILRFVGTLREGYSSADYCIVTPRKIFQYITNSLNQALDDVDDPDNEVIQVRYVETTSNFGYMALNEICSQMANAISVAQVVISGLQTIGKSMLSSVSDYVSIFENVVRTKFENLSEDVMKVYNYVIDILSDGFSSIGDKTVQLMNLVSNGLQSVNSSTTVNNIFADYTGVSVWTAFCAEYTAWYDAVNAVVSRVGKAVFYLTNELLNGVLTKVVKNLKASVGIQDTFTDHSDFEVHGFSDFITKITGIPSNVAPNVYSKLNKGLLTFDLPTARVYISGQSGNTFDMLIQWKPVMPWLFDRYIGPIKSQSGLGLTLYTNPPSSFHNSSVYDVFGGICRAAEESALEVPHNNLEMYESIWLAQYCFVMYIIILYAYDQDIESMITAFAQSQYAAPLLALLNGGKAYNQYASNSNIGNRIIAELLCSYNQATLASIPYSGIANYAKLGLNLVLTQIENAASDLYWTSYDYARRIAAGKYSVLSDSNLSNIAISGIIGAAITVVVTSTFIAIRRLKKAAYRNNAKASAASFNAFNQQTGQLVRPALLKDAYKADKISRLYSNIARSMGSLLTNVSTAVSSVAARTFSAAIAGVKNIVTGGSATTSSSTTLNSIHSDVAGVSSDIANSKLALEGSIAGVSTDVANSQRSLEAYIDDSDADVKELLVDIQRHIYPQSE